MQVGIPRRTVYTPFPPQHVHVYFPPRFRFAPTHQSRNSRSDKNASNLAPTYPRTCSSPTPRLPYPVENIYAQPYGTGGNSLQMPRERTRRRLDEPYSVFASFGFSVSMDFCISENIFLFFAASKLGCSWK